MAAVREGVAHQIFAWGAGQHSAVRAYQCDQIVVEIDNRSVIPDEVGEPCGYKDKAGRPFLCRTLIESNNAELRGLSKGARCRPSNVDRFLPVPVHPQIIRELQVNRGPRKDRIARCETFIRDNQPDSGDLRPAVELLQITMEFR